MEDWRLEQSRGSDALRAKMNQALSYARFETIAEKLLDQCLLYLPADMSNFLVEVLRKQLEQPFRELFLLLGEKYTALDPHPELLPWLIDELQKPSIEEAACRLREQNDMNNKQPAAPESAADDELSAFEREEAEIARLAAVEARSRPEYLRLTMHKCGASVADAMKAVVTLVAPAHSGEAAVERHTLVKDVAEGQCTWDELLEFPSDSAWRDADGGSLTVSLLTALASGPLTLQLKTVTGEVVPVGLTVEWESQAQRDSRQQGEQQLADARGAAAEQSTSSCSWKKAAKMVVLFLGPPGSGKVTHGGRLSAGLGVPLVKCGEALRDAVDAGTPAGVAAAASAQSGKMVPDDLMLEVLLERVQASDCAEGLVLEGFPRNAAQVAMVSTLAAELAGVVQFDASDELLVARVAGKWVHKASGRVYHAEHKKPASIDGENMTDDVTGEPLSKKPSDEPAALKERLSRWRSAAAVGQQLEAVGNVYPIDVGGSIESVAAAVDEVIEKIKKREAPPDRTAEKEAAAKAAEEKEAADKAAAEKAAADKEAADKEAADKEAADKAAADKAAAEKEAADKAAAEKEAADKAAADKAAAEAADKAAAEAAAPAEEEAAPAEEEAAPAEEEAAPAEEEAAPAEEEAAPAEEEPFPVVDEAAAAEEAAAAAAAEEAAAAAEEKAAAEASAAEAAGAAEAAAAAEKEAADKAAAEAAAAEAAAAEAAAAEKAAADKAAAEAAMTPEELEAKRAQDEFDRMDKDTDGTVTRSEWQEFEAEKEIADVDGNGVVDEKEWDEFDKKKERGEIVMPPIE